MDLEPADRTVTHRIQTVTLSQEVFDRAGYRLERLAFGSVMRSKIRRRVARARAARRVFDAGSGRSDAHLGVEVIQVKQRTGADHRQFVCGIQTEKIDAGFAVDGDIRPK